MDKTIKIMLIIILILLIVSALRVTVFKEKEFYADAELEESKVEVAEEENKEKIEYDKRVEAFVRHSSIEYMFTMQMITLSIVLLLFVILPTIGIWKIFKDANIPGWYSIIPLLSTLKLYDLVGVSPLCIFLAFIPFIGQILILIVNIVVCHRLAQRYNKNIGYTLGLIFLPFIFYPLIAFKGINTQRRNIVV